MGTASQRAVIVTLSTALLTTAMQGQNPTAQPSSVTGFATITGIAVDSVRGGPLVGATVTVEGSLRSAVSDSMGRFRIDSIEPGGRRVGMFHPLLDSLGFGVSSPPLDLKAGDALLVGLATPSATTVVARLCRNAAPPPDGQSGPVLLVGRVLDADTDAPVAGVHVSISWAHEQVTAAGVHRVLATRDTTTAAGGVFHFCELPAGLKVLVRATRNAAADTTAANEVIDRQYDIGHQLVGMVAVHVPAVAKTSASAPRALATLSGRVVHLDGTPAVAARVLVLGSPDSALTGDNGQFELHARPGSRTLVVRALGYVPVESPVEITTRETRKIDVALGARIALLDSIKVVGQLKAGYAKVGFDRRRQSGTGHYLTAEDIAKSQATTFLDLFVTMPGVRVAYGSNGEQYLAGTRGGGGCVNYVVDGFPYREMVRGDLDAFLRPQDIAAIEVYSPNQVPADLIGVTNPMGVQAAPKGPARLGTTASTGGCTVVVVWTNSQFGL